MLLSKKFEDLEYLFDSTNFNFDVIVISETRIAKNKVPINHIDLTIIVTNIVRLNRQLVVFFFTFIFCTKQGMI